MRTRPICTCHPEERSNGDLPCGMRSLPPTEDLAALETIDRLKADGSPQCQGVLRCAQDDVRRNAPLRRVAPCRAVSRRSRTLRHSGVRAVWEFAPSGIPRRLGFRAVSSALRAVTRHQPQRTQKAGPRRRDPASLRRRSRVTRSCRAACARCASTSPARCRRAA